MQKRDTSDVMLSALAVALDAAAIFFGFLLATWIRFDSGWFALVHERPVQVYQLYGLGAAVATLMFLFVFQSKGLYVRPQTGTFPDKIPRLLKAVGLSIVLTVVMAFAFKNEAVGQMTTDFARLVIAISAVTVMFLVLLERYILFRIEWNLARHSRDKSNVLLVGTDSVAWHVKRSLQKESMLRARVVGFLQSNDSAADADIPSEMILGELADLGETIADQRIDQVILTDANIGHRQIVEILLLCEKNLVTFKMVPDLFRIMTTSMDVQSLSDIPLLGISRWPLDLFWNRLLKRAEDIVGAIVGLLVSAPVIMIAAIMIKRSSMGAVFYHQERCGESGHSFMLHKLRTMSEEAEAESGPVWTVENDGRRTKVGALLRKYNIDELPQFWNVLCGDMSLVGPRPERPHFVEKFKDDIGRYMWRHVSKPGITGWAQVNGLRGNTDLNERIKYDLYYLENWSLAFDFKILMKTINARENAY